MAGTDRFLQSRSGEMGLPIITGPTGSMSISDQWYAFMNQSPVTFANTFTVNKEESFTNVLLRWDNTKGYCDNTKHWELEIVFDIDIYDETSLTTPVGTFTNQKLRITYDPQEGVTYKDKDLLRLNRQHRCFIND